MDRMHVLHRSFFIPQKFLPVTVRRLRKFKMMYYVLLLLTLMGNYADCQSPSPRITTIPPFLDENCCSTPAPYRQNCVIPAGALTRQACYQNGCCYVDDGGGACFRPLQPPCPSPLTPVLETPTGKCAIPTKNRADCGYPGITSTQCESQDCCYDERIGEKAPTCYFSSLNAPRPGDWSDWSPCPPELCSTGKRTRNRLCFYEDGKKAPNPLCKQRLKETKACTCEKEPTDDKSTSKACEDSTDSCEGFTSLCDSSVSFKTTLCRKTCNTCNAATSATPPRQPGIASPVKCVDTYESCKSIKQYCKDPYYDKDLRENCPVTCNFCGSEMKAKVTTPPPQSAATQQVPTSKVKAKVTTAPTQRPAAARVPTIVPERRSPTPVPGCTDESPYCKSNVDLCTTGTASDIQSMRDLCKRTCNACGSGQPSKEPPFIFIPPTTTPTTTPIASFTTREACSDSMAICGNYAELCSQYETNWHTLCRRTCNTCGRNDNTRPKILPTQSATKTQFTISYPPIANTLPTASVVVTGAPSQDCTDKQDNCLDLKTFCTYVDEEIGSIVRQVCRRTCGVCGTRTDIRTPDTPKLNTRPYTLTQWSVCSVTCGDGVRTRMKLCAQEGRGCSSETQRQGCNMGNCDSTQAPETPRYTLTQWSVCSVSCGKGVKTRMKICSQEAGGCLSEMQREDCNIGNCDSIQAPQTSCKDDDEKWCKRMNRVVTKFCSNEQLASKCKASCDKC